MWECTYISVYIFENYRKGRKKMQDSKHGYPNMTAYQQMDHVVVILVQTDVFCVAWATCWMRRLCGRSRTQNHRTLQGESSTECCVSWKLAPKLSFSFGCGNDVSQDLGHTIFEGLWSIKHDLIVFILFTNRLRYLPRGLYKYKTVHSWTRTLVYSPNFFPSSLTSRVANCLPVENLISETILWKC